jgi:Protein of unknown function (DUF1552)
MTHPSFKPESKARSAMFNRRLFLRGAGGIALALPALDIFSRYANAQSSARIYSCLMLQQNGAVQGHDEPDRFWPRNYGPLNASAMLGADADRTTSELSDYADRLNFVRGLDFHYSNNHDGGPVAASTGAPVTGSGTSQLPVSESADVFIANRLTPNSSPLTLYAGRKGTFRDDAFSFDPGGRLRVGDNNPWNVYQRLTGLSGADPAEVDRVALRRESVNDLVREDLTALLARKDLSREDRERLDLHLTNVRDMENEILDVIGPTPVASDFQAVDGEHTESARMEQVVKLQFDLIAFAFASDRARTATLQVGGCNDHTRYLIDGVEAPPFHYVSHRVMSDGGEGEGIPNGEDLHHQIDRIHARFFKHLLDRLEAYSMPWGGTLLDSSINLWTNSVSNGPAHSGDNVPHVLAGGANGFLKTGLHIESEGYTAKALNTIISATGVRKDNGDLVDDFGDPDAQGVLSELLV